MPPTLKPEDRLARPALCPDSVLGRPALVLRRRVHRPAVQAGPAAHGLPTIWCGLQAGDAAPSRRARHRRLLRHQPTCFNYAGVTGWLDTISLNPAVEKTPPAPPR
jgi:hypothetical protein